MVKKKKEISVASELESLKKGERNKQIKAQAKELLRAEQEKQSILLQQRAAFERRKRIGFMGSKAEQLELEAVSWSEVPMLVDMERQRTRKTMVSNNFLNRIEKEVTDSFPD